jgi:hypothetical protein
MKSMLILVLAVALLGFTGSLYAGTTVMGQNNPALDVEAVQNAVNAGGKILLIGTFDFGQGMVNITNSVEITGPATINNAFSAFRMPGAPEADIKISNITINMAYIPILVQGDGKNLTIDNVYINGILLEEIEPGLGYRYARKGIWIAGPNQWWTRPLPWPAPTDDYYNDPSRFKYENIIITNCYVDGVGVNPADGAPWNPYTGSSERDPRSCSILVAWGIGTLNQPANVLVEGNTVINFTYVTIALTDIVGTGTVKNNTTKKGDTGILYYPPGYPPFSFDIVVGNHYRGSGWGDGPDYSNYTVIGNAIEEVPQTFPDGSPYYGTNFALFVFGIDGAIVRKNEIISNNANCKVLLSGVNETYFGQNKFNGQANAVFGGIISLAGISSNNVFVGNNLANLTTPSPTYFLTETTKFNTVRGFTGGSDSVVDLGTENYLTGVTPMSGAEGVGQYDIPGIGGPDPEEP